MSASQLVGPLDAIAQSGVVPVVTLDDPSTALPVAEALAAGGLPCAEVTLRTPTAIESIAAIASALPDFLLGAGTVVTGEQAEAAIDAGAVFLVSPGFSPGVSAVAARRVVPYVPGVVTPTELMAALAHGWSTLKFFPAGTNGGPPAIAAIAAPFPDVRFVPTGGIGPQTLPDYLAIGAVAACGGSWLTPVAAVAGRRFEEVTRLAAEARRIVEGVRGAS